MSFMGENPFYLSEKHLKKGDKMIGPDGKKYTVSGEKDNDTYEVDEPKDVKEASIKITGKEKVKDVFKKDQLVLSKYLKNKLGKKAKKVIYFDDTDLVYGDITVVSNAGNKNITVDTLLKTLEKVI